MTPDEISNLRGKIRIQLGHTFDVLIKTWDFYLVEALNEANNDLIKFQLKDFEARLNGSKKYDICSLALELIINFIFTDLVSKGLSTYVTKLFGTTSEVEKVFTIPLSEKFSVNKNDYLFSKGFIDVRVMSTSKDVILSLTSKEIIQKDNIISKFLNQAISTGSMAASDKTKTAISAWKDKFKEFDTKEFTSKLILVFGKNSEDLENIRRIWSEPEYEEWKKFSEADLVNIDKITSEWSAKADEMAANRTDLFQNFKCLYKACLLAIYYNGDLFNYVFDQGLGKKYTYSNSKDALQEHMVDIRDLLPDSWYDIGLGKRQPFVFYRDPKPENISEVQKLFNEFPDENSLSYLRAQYHFYLDQKKLDTSNYKSFHKISEVKKLPVSMSDDALLQLKYYLLDLYFHYIYQKSLSNYIIPNIFKPDTSQFEKMQPPSFFGWTDPNVSGGGYLSNP